MPPALAMYQSPKLPSGSAAFMYKRLSPDGDHDGELHRQFAASTRKGPSVLLSRVPTSRFALCPELVQTIATVSPSAATAGAPQSCCGVVSDCIGLFGPVCNPSTVT